MSHSHSYHATDTLCDDGTKPATIPCRALPLLLIWTCIPLAFFTYTITSTTTHHLACPHRRIEEGRLREAEDVAAVEALADEGTAEARGAAAHAAEVRERVQALRREAAEGARREGEAEAETREGARRAAAVAAAAARVVATARGEANAVATAATAAGREGEAWRLLASAADGYRAAESALGMGAWDRAVGAEDGVEFDLLSSSGPMDARWRVEELEEELGRVRAEAAGAVVAAEERWRVEEARRVEECAKRVEEAAEGEGKALVERVGQVTRSVVL